MAKTKLQYLDELNALLKEAHEAGHQLYVDTSDAVDHWWPAFNPCADVTLNIPGVEEVVPWWKVIVRRVAVGIATDCRCCNGLRIVCAGLGGIALGWLLG